MIVPDVNLLVYAHNAGVPEHDVARQWWERTVNGAEPVGLPWAVVLGFVRLMSSPRVAERPQTPQSLLEHVDLFLEAPSVRFVTPGARHVRIMRSLYDESGAGTRLVTDIHIAALAIELGATLATNDTDFLRFKDLTTVNPLG